MRTEEFRSIALAMLAVSESAHMGHPDFRIGGKIFATLGYPDERFGAVCLDLESKRISFDRIQVPSPLRRALGDAAAAHRSGSTR